MLLSLFNNQSNTKWIHKVFFDKKLFEITLWGGWRDIFNEQINILCFTWTFNFLYFDFWSKAVGQLQPAQSRPRKFWSSIFFKHLRSNFLDSKPIWFNWFKFYTPCIGCQKYSGGKKFDKLANQNDYSKNCENKKFYISN